MGAGIAASPHCAETWTEPFVHLGASALAGVRAGNDRFVQPSSGVAHRFRKPVGVSLAGHLTFPGASAIPVPPDALFQALQPSS